MGDAGDKVGTDRTRGTAWGGVADIPSQDGRVAVVTGANGGLGLETARALAAKGAHVVLAARDQAKTADAVGTITRRGAEARLTPCRSTWGPAVGAGGAQTDPHPPRAVDCW